MEGRNMIREIIECMTMDAPLNEQRRSFFNTLKKMIFAPGYRAVALYRISFYLRFECRSFPRLSKLLGTLLFVKLCNNPGVEIRAVKKIGQGLKIYHPHDVVIGVGAIVGKNVSIYNGVTLGARTILANDTEKEHAKRYPIIEDNVTIFSGAKIIGPVRIGKNSIVGANSVVNKSFPPNSVIAGIPARLIKKLE